MDQKRSWMNWACQTLLIIQKRFYKLLKKCTQQFLPWKNISNIYMQSDSLYIQIINYQFIFFLLQKDSHYSTMHMQHYALFLQGLDYVIKYKNSKCNANSYCLSRFPIKSEYFDLDTDVFEIDTIQTMWT